MKKITLPCDRCNADHTYELSDELLNQGMPLSFACLNIKRLPRVTHTRIDFTKNSPISQSDEIKSTAYKYGEFKADEKNARKNQINDPKMWLVHDFDLYFEEIIDAYISGAFYPVATACTSLAERLLNLFILKMRDLYSKSILDPKLQKHVYTKNQNWQSLDLNLEVMDAWGILSVDQKKWFNELLDIRNRAVHFQPSFDPQADSLLAIKTLHKIIDSYFSPFERKDIIRLFEIPGEMWVRESKLNDPFVKAFVLPCCNMFASCGALNKNSSYHENAGIVGNFSEEEFIKQRERHNFDPKNFNLNLEYEPVYKKTPFEGGEISYRII